MITHLALNGAVPQTGDVGGPIKLQNPVLHRLTSGIGGNEIALPPGGPLARKRESGVREARRRNGDSAGNHAKDVLHDEGFLSMYKA